MTSLESNAVQLASDLTDDTRLAAQSCEKVLEDGSLMTTREHHQDNNHRGLHHNILLQSFCFLSFVVTIDYFTMKLLFNSTVMKNV